MKVSAEAVAEEEEAGETADGRGMDRALIVDGEFEAREVVWTPVPAGIERRLRLVMEHAGQSRCWRTRLMVVGVNFG